MIATARAVFDAGDASAAMSLPFNFKLHARDDRALIVGRYRPSPRTQTVPIVRQERGNTPTVKTLGSANHRSMMALQAYHSNSTTFGWFMETGRVILGIWDGPTDVCHRLTVT